MEPKAPFSSSSTDRVSRIKLVVAYDGTDFRGWAAQAGRRTVQGTLKEAVRRVTGEDVEIVGASRTDSGAHARGQVCHFDCNAGLAEGRWVLALNKVLPKDVAVMRSNIVPESFHSRFCAEDRFYRYTIACGHRNPLRSRYVFDYQRPLDLDEMRKAAEPLVGRHDFRSFTEELDKTVLNTVRVIRSIKVDQVGDEVRIDVVATAYLRGMMRRISGLLLEVGRGKRPVSDASALIAQETTMHLPVVLPACGLTLMKVRYGRHPKDNRTASAKSLGADNDSE